MLRSLAAAARLPAAAAACQRLLHLGRGIGRGEEVESVAYRMSMLRAPSVVRKGAIISSNSCSLIGRLYAPVRPYYDSSEENPEAYTFLSVTPPSSSSSSSSYFSVMLQLKGELAKLCLKHLKYKDLVYVSGFLISYCGVNATGERCIYYKIHVKELNYVLDHNKKPMDVKDSADPASTPSASTEILEENKYKDRLRLWQVFFASPYEWWDNRQQKRYINSPDFKHKDTHEKLWLHPDDPPWVRKQLELLDQQTAEIGRRHDKDSADPASAPAASTELLEENKYKDRLRLWEVFFASPYEWWDNRRDKPYAKSPDFKHKDTHEKLWLHPDDPPWVRKQLELLDQQTAVIGRRDDNDSADPASAPSTSTELLEENKYKDRLRLWQVFFASPYEWWDNRQQKRYINSPDFKHKDTHEKLWLHPDDPPWVRKQLELIDQQTSEIGRRDDRGRLTNPRWNGQDFNYSDEWHHDEQEPCQANG